MGFGGISIWQLLIILAIVLLLFGTKRLRNLGGDLGSAFKGFKKAMSDEEQSEPQKLEKGEGKTDEGKPVEGKTIEGEATKDKEKQG